MRWPSPRRLVAKYHLLQLALAVAIFYGLLVTVSPRLQGALDFDAERLSHQPNVNLQEALDRLRAGDSSFDWNGWLDLSKTETYDSGDLDPKLYPYLRNHPSLSTANMPLMHHSSQQEHAMVALLYCRKYMPAPYRVISLPDPRLSLAEQISQMETWPVHGNALSHRQYGQNEASIYQSIPAGQSLADLSGKERLMRDVPEELFKWNTSAVEPIPPSENASDQQKSDYAHDMMVYRALKDVQDSGKYFEEVRLQKDPQGHGLHYDWRFFRGVADYNAHRSAIHHLSRTWNQFADIMGLIYWYQHGSLLGWWWNGLTMPWDADNDIQMPFKELDRLAQLNGSLVVQSSVEGTRAYFIDVSPWYVERTRGNGNNVIDARFIDVSTGAYIDVTGLAYADEKATSVSCKNNHMYRVNRLAPLRRTLYEGSPTYMPRDFTRMLMKEYTNYDKDVFEKWFFNHKAQLWELEQTCEAFINSYPAHSLVHCIPRDVMSEEECNNSGWREKLDTCDAETIGQWEKTKGVTSSHLHMIELWNDTSGILDRNVKEYEGILATYHPPIYNVTLD